jgi:hypothetical protein
VKIANFLRRALTPDDRFARARKVMVRIVTRLLTRSYGFGNRLFEAAPVIVAQP